MRGVVPVSCFLNRSAVAKQHRPSAVLIGLPSVSLGYSSTGWTVIVQSRCRHLRAITRDGSACAIFGQDERPITCRQLSAVDAPIVTVLSKNPPDFVHVDAHHLIATLYRFDTHRTRLSMRQAHLESSHLPPNLVGVSEWISFVRILVHGYHT